MFYMLETTGLLPFFRFSFLAICEIEKMPNFQVFEDLCENAEKASNIHVLCIRNDTVFVVFINLENLIFPSAHFRCPMPKITRNTPHMSTP